MNELELRNYINIIIGNDNVNNANIGLWKFDLSITPFNITIEPYMSAITLHIIQPIRIEVSRNVITYFLAQNPEGIDGRGIGDLIGHYFIFYSLQP